MFVAWHCGSHSLKKERKKEEEEEEEEEEFIYVQRGPGEIVRYVVVKSHGAKF